MEHMDEVCTVKGGGIHDEGMMYVQWSDEVSMMKYAQWRDWISMMRDDVYTVQWEH